LPVDHRRVISSWDPKAAPNAAVIAKEVAVGDLLESNGIDFDEALRGSLWTSSDKP
jgi:hypothetical protein